MNEMYVYLVDRGVVLPCEFVGKGDLLTPNDKWSVLPEDVRNKEHKFVDGNFVSDRYSVARTVNGSVQLSIERDEGYLNFIHRIIETNKNFILEAVTGLNDCENGQVFVGRNLNSLVDALHLSKQSRIKQLNIARERLKKIEKGEETDIMRKNYDNHKVK